MNSETLEVKQLTSAETDTTIASGVPHDIVDEILDRLSTNPDFRLSLLACSLISKSWVTPCRRRLFRTISFTGKEMTKWLKTFPVPERSPAHLVRVLTLSLGGCHAAPEEFFTHTHWFTNVERMTVLGIQGFQPVWIPSFGKLPRSVTSLTIDTDIVSLLEIRDVMQQLPNLNDLTLSGRLLKMGVDRLRGIGTVLKGGFNGQLRLFRLKRYAETDVMNMLLEVPTGLRFTEVHIHSVYGCLLPTVRLTEACGKSLAKFTYSVQIFGKSHPFLYLWLFLANIVAHMISVQMVTRASIGPLTFPSSRISKK